MPRSVLAGYGPFVPSFLRWSIAVAGAWWVGCGRRWPCASIIGLLAYRGGTMITEGYELVLYCRLSPVSTGEDMGSSSGERLRWHVDRRHLEAHTYYGEGRAQARRRARGAGWVFAKGDVLCPRCVVDKRR